MRSEFEDIFEGSPFLNYDADARVGARQNTPVRSIKLMSYHRALDHPDIATYDEFVDWLEYCEAHSLNFTNVFKHRCYYVYWWFDDWTFQAGPYTHSSKNIWYRSPHLWKIDHSNGMGKIVYDAPVDIKIVDALKTDPVWWKRFLQRVLSSTKYMHNLLRDATITDSALAPLGFDRAELWRQTLIMEILVTVHVFWLQQRPNSTYYTEVPTWKPSSTFDYGMIRLWGASYHVDTIYRPTHPHLNNSYVYRTLGTGLHKVPDQPNYMDRLKSYLQGDEVTLLDYLVDFMEANQGCKIAIVGEALWHSFGYIEGEPSSIVSWVHILIERQMSFSRSPLEDQLPALFDGMNFRFSYTNNFARWAQMQNLDCMRAWYDVSLDDITCFPSFCRAIATTHCGPPIYKDLDVYQENEIGRAMDAGFQVLLSDAMVDRMEMTVQV